MAPANIIVSSKLQRTHFQTVSKYLAYLICGDASFIFAHFPDVLGPSRTEIYLVLLTKFATFNSWLIQKDETQISKYFIILLEFQGAMHLKF